MAFLAPLDPFVWDRDFLRALYGFDYVWEVYVPAARRRWGYYVLPILFGDRLVGRIEPRFDRRAGTLRVLDLWWEDGFDPLVADGFVEALTDALEAHARFGEVGADRPAARRLAIGRSRRPSAPDSGRGAGSGDDVDRVPGAPVAGLVPGSDPDVVAVAAHPGLARLVLVVVPHDFPVGRAAPGLDLEVAQPCGQDLEAGVGARPVDRDAHVSGIDGSLA